MSKVVIVGCGNVGIKYAYSCINNNTKIDELVLIDVNREKVLGEALDLSHAATSILSNIKVKVGEYSDCTDADIVLIAAGVNQEKHQSRLDLTNKNANILKEITLNVSSSGFRGIFLVATNPVDIMTYVVRKYSNLPSNRIIGSGTILDSDRLKYYLSQKLQINSKNIHAYVIGEHGDSSFVLWSKATAGVVNIKSIMTDYDMNLIENEVKRSAYNIINYKGETSYAIGDCLLKITNAILNDEDTILSVSSPVDEIYIGMPSVINKKGIKGVMSISFTNEEQTKFEKSKEVIRDIIKSMEV